MKKDNTTFAALFFLLFFSLFVFWAAPVFADSPPPPANTGSQVNLTVNGCNDNGICEMNLGENDMTCSVDCPTSTPPTSTPPPTSPPPSPAGPSGGNVPPLPPPTLEISSIVIQQSGDNIVVTWTTTNTSLSVFSWGTSSDEEAGSISEVTYTLHHSETIIDVLPDTRYYIEIRARDLYGGSLDYVGEFTTASLPNANPLPNVSDAGIRFENNSFLLSWVNPNDSRVMGVRVVRSPYGYPTDPLDGKVIYQGDGHYAVDSGITMNTEYYYTIFSYDAVGDYSSGAILEGEWVPGGSAAATTTAATTTPPIACGTSTETVAGSAFVFSQNNIPIHYSGAVVNIDGTLPLTISLASTTPGVGASGGVVSITVPPGAAYSGGPENYLLELNASDIAFESEIDFSHAPPGNYPFSITVGQALGPVKTFCGTFDIYQPSHNPERVGLSWADILIIIIIFLIFLLFLLILAVLISGLFKRDEQ